MARLRALCVFCGAAGGSDPRYANAAAALGRAAALDGVRLIYGGGRVGLMGALADAAIAAGGKVTGVIPGHLHDREVAHPGVSEMIVVDSMHARKAVMFSRADAFCVLPGGFGTLDETFEIITWKQIDLHAKPVVLVNVSRYWESLVEVIETIFARGFAHASEAALLTVVDDVSEAIPEIRRRLLMPANADRRRQDI